MRKEAIMSKTLVILYDDIIDEASILKDALENEIRCVLKEDDRYEVKVQEVNRNNYILEIFADDLISNIESWKTTYDKVKILIDLCLLEDSFIDYPSGAVLVERLNDKVKDLSDFLSVYIITSKVLGGSDYDKNIDERLKNYIRNFTYMGFLEKPIYYDKDKPCISDKISCGYRYTNIIPKDYIQMKDNLAFVYAVLKGEKK